jgi:hypothetical protein
MKVAVSIPDPIFEAAEKLARSRGLPRSQVYAQALERYVEEHGAAVVTEQLNAVYGGQDCQRDASLDESLARAQQATLADEAW